MDDTRVAFQCIDNETKLKSRRRRKILKIMPNWAEQGINDTTASFVYKGPVNMSSQQRSLKQSS